MSNKYHLHVTGSDSLGLNFLENVVEMANLGATIKEGTLPAMRFPHSLSMTLEAETPPTPKATLRVFHHDSNKEVYAAFVKPVAATFSTEEADDSDETLDESAKSNFDLSTNQGTPWTKEQLDAMEFEGEFREVCRSVGITGRSRDKMTKQYLDKFSK